MNVLQNLKEFFSRYFPLHLNSTVEDLEDDLADAELELYFSKAREENLRDALQVLRETNGALARDNRCLSDNLHAARMYIREQQHELDEFYGRIVPTVNEWPFGAKTSLEETSFSSAVLRLDLPPLRLNTLVTKGIRDGLHKQYQERLAQQLASAAYKEVKEAVLDILKVQLSQSK